MATEKPPAYDSVVHPAPQPAPQLAPQPGYYKQAPGVPVQTVMQTQPAVTPMYIQTEGKPENYLLLSVLNMVLCCFLCGLIALIYSLRVDSAWNTGDREGAKRAAQTAKNWNIVGIVSGIITIVLTVIISVVVGVVVPFVVFRSLRG